MSADSRMLSVRVAWFQASTVAALLIASLFVAGAAHGETSTIGRTFPIVEPDALAEIEAKAAALPKDLGPKFGPRSRWSAMKSASLAPAGPVPRLGGGDAC